jgi:hypothetical protein
VKNTAGHAPGLMKLGGFKMLQSELPLWLQYGQALGPPLLAAVIGSVGAWIALQQMHLARIKLQHDTYDRKYAVFAAVHWLLTGISAFKRAPNLVDMRDFINEIGAASFLFDDKLVVYLNEIESRVHRAHGLNEMMNNFPDDSKAAASRELAEHILWLGEQSGVITEKFRPSLGLRKPRSRIFPWLRRATAWPLG